MMTYRHRGFSILLYVVIMLPKVDQNTVVLHYYVAGLMEIMWSRSQILD